MALICSLVGTTWQAPVMLRPDEASDFTSPEPCGEATMVNTSGMSVTWTAGSTAPSRPATASVTGVPQV